VLPGRAPHCRSTHAAIWALLTDGLPAVLTSHARLDGDAVGSTLALWHALRNAGVEAHVFFEPPTPAVFDCLPGMEMRASDVSQLPPAHHLVVIDCSSLDRAGERIARLPGRAQTVNIDHHASNTRFGDLNCVAPTASSSGEMVYALLAANGVALTAAIAECLFAAILTDTGRFSHQDTTPEALEACAECIRAGAAPDEVARQVFPSPSRAQVELRNMAMGTLRFHADGRIASMAVTAEMFGRTGLAPVDTEGFVEALIGIRGVSAAVLLKEMPGDGCVKVSMRSRDPVDACAVAALYGGGGHRYAAGCEIAQPTDDVRRMIVDQLRRHLRATSAG